MIKIFHMDIRAELKGYRFTCKISYYFTCGRSVPCRLKASFLNTDRGKGVVLQ